MKYRPLFLLAFLLFFAATAPAEEGRGRALRFDGLGDNVLIRHTNELNAFPLTVTAWLRTTQAVQVGAPPIVAKMTSVTNGWQVYMSNGTIRARYVLDSANFLSGNNSGLAGGLNGGAVADNIFHHVAFTVDATGGRLYVDGVLRDSRPWVGTPGPPTTTDTVRLGLHNNASFIGTLDEVTIWNVALSQTEILNHRHRSLAGTEPGLLAYYRFNESGGINMADSAPAGGDNVGISGSATRIPSGIPFIPAVATQFASGLTQTNATLNGTANPSDTNATAWFEFGFSTNYGFVTPPQDIGSGSVDTNFSASISNLLPGVSYHFRAVASNSFGIAFGDDENFPNFAQRDYIKASDGGQSQYFGGGVAIDGDTMVVGANGANSGAGRTGAAYVFVRSGDSWIQQAKLVASNAGHNDEFGSSVAISGATIVIGAPSETSNATGVNGNQNDNSVNGAGAAYVFVRTGTNWSQQAYLKVADAEGVCTVGFCTGCTCRPGDAFGSSVAVSGDTIVVGAPYDDSNATGVNGNVANNSKRDSGAAYIFARSGTTWTQQAYLKASNTDGAPSVDTVGDFFGAAVSVSGDTVVIGASQEDSNATGINGDQGNNSATNSGAVYVFVRSGTAWTQQAYIKASNTDLGDGFGGALSLSGTTLVIGAGGEDSNATGINGDQNNNNASAAGAAYVFVRSGATWTQQAYLKAANTGIGDTFGGSLSLSGDTVAILAPLEDSNATGVNGDAANDLSPNSGAAYLFTRSGATWVFQNYLKASNAESNDFSGFDPGSVAVSGGFLVLGVPEEDSNARGINGDQRNNSAFSSGAAYVFGPPLPPIAEIAVLTSNANIIDGASGPLMIAAVGHPSFATFTVRNTGNGPLTDLGISFDGPDAAMFSVAEPPSRPLPPASNTTFTIRFQPTSVGTKTAALHLSNNDLDENPFDVVLSGLSLSFAQDLDGDGLNDASELLMTSLGFQFQVNQTSLVQALFQNANGAGLFTASQLQALNVNSPLLTRDANTGLFTLTIGVEKATQLTNFFPFPMTAPQTLINAEGKLEFQFSAPDGAAVFRLEAR